MKDIELIEYLVDHFDDYGPLLVNERMIKTRPSRNVISSEWIALEQEAIRRHFSISYEEDNKMVFIFPLEDKK